MLQPIINSKKTVKMSLDTFGGLNPRDDLGAGELYKAKNICTEAKGKLQSCKARTPVLTSLNFDFVECMILPQTETHLTSFTGIASKDGVKSFYFKGTKIGDLQNTVHSVVDFSG
ncbi:MAG: hypothetical protein Q8882_08975, partial [Bacillota bacterium]|nr:hypothetical protein [Bacillota bacterium]